MRYYTETRMLWPYGKSNRKGKSSKLLSNNSVLLHVESRRGEVQHAFFSIVKNLRLNSAEKSDCSSHLVFTITTDPHTST